MQNVKPFGTGGTTQEEIGVFTQLLMPDIANRMSIFASLVIILAGWATCGIEVFLRYRFGIRYFNPLRAVIGFVMLNVVFVALGYHPVPHYLYYRSLIDWLMAILQNNPLVFWYVLLSVTHIVIGWWKTYHDGALWHTRFFGESTLMWIIRRLPLKIVWLPGEWLTYRLFEPGIVLFLGLLLRQSNYILANWLCLMACLLWLRAQIVYTQMLNSLFDRHDALIEATYWQDAMNGVASNRTAGFVTVTGIPGLSKQPRTKPTDIKATVAETMKQPADHRNAPSGD